MNSDPRPRVLVLVKGLGLGGVERLLSESIPYLSRDRFDYEVCYLTPWKDDVVPVFQEAGIPTFCLDISNETNPGNFRRMRRFLREREYQLIHSHSPFPSVIARLVAPRKSLRGFVHTEHSLPGSRNLSTRVSNRMTYRFCDVVISVSGVVRDAVEATPVLVPKSSRIIYGGVNQEELDLATRSDKRGLRESLAIPDDHLVVGNLAHLRPQKGLDTWLEVASTIIGERPNTSFVIVGREKEAGYQAHLESLAAKLGIAEQVHLTGFQPDPYPFLAAFDVFLMTSEFEGFPIALVEAMALGTPVVSTAVGGVREALGPDPVGLMAAPGDPATLANHVLHLLSDEATRSALASRARERALTEFSLRTMVERVEAVYEELLAP